MNIFEGGNMEGCLNLEIGIRPIQPNNLGQVITALQTKLNELQSQYPQYEITGAQYTWKVE